MKRVAAIDIAKGIAISLVLLGHIPQTPNPLRVWLYSFHMPLFFLLSGYVFSTKKYPCFRIFLIKKIKTLLLPYFMLNCLLFASVTLYDGIKNTYHALPFFNEFDIISFIKGLFLSYRLQGPYFSLWFINILFLSELLLYFIQKYFCKRSYVYAVIALVLIFFQPLVFHSVKGMYWSIDLLPTALSFLCLGSFFKHFFPEIKTKNSLLTIAFISFIINVALCYVNYAIYGTTDLYYCWIGNVIIFFFAATAGSLFVLTISTMIRKNTLLEFSGKNSILYYTFNNILVIPFVEDAFGILLSSTTNTFLFVPVFILSWTLLALISIIVNRFFPFVIGKRYLQNKPGSSV